MKVESLFQNSQVNRHNSAAGSQNDASKRSETSGEGRPAHSTDEQKDGLSFPAKLNWLNASYRKLAERRFQDMRRNSLPYIVAQQKVGSVIAYNDGSIAYHQIAMKASNTKMFGNEGVAWDSDRAKTTFFCLLPGGSELMPLGSVEEMQQQGLNGSEIGSLLDVNQFYDEPDEEDDPAMEAEWQAVSRVSFYLLSANGQILPKDQRAAEAIMKPLTDEQKKNAIANVMAMSAGSHELTFLELALALGHDPNQRSRLVEATPLEHAEKKGNETAVLRLRPFRPK